MEDVCVSWCHTAGEEQYLLLMSAMNPTFTEQYYLPQTLLTSYITTEMPVIASLHHSDTNIKSEFSYLQYNHAKSEA